MFALKAVVKQHPSEVLVGSLFCSILLFAYMLRIFEMPLSDASGHNYDEMFKCVWNTIITLNSVGYGDMYPKSNMGRFVACLICFWGFISSAYYVVTIFNVLAFEDN